MEWECRCGIWLESGKRMGADCLSGKAIIFRLDFTLFYGLQAVFML